MFAPRVAARSLAAPNFSAVKIGRPKDGRRWAEIRGPRTTVSLPAIGWRENPSGEPMREAAKTDAR